MEITAIASPAENTQIDLVSSQPLKPERPDIVTLSDNSTKTYRGYLLTVTNPERVTLGLSSKLGKSGEVLSTIVSRNQAVAGINAGGRICRSGRCWNRR